MLKLGCNGIQLSLYRLIFNVAILLLLLACFSTARRTNLVFSDYLITFIIAVAIFFFILRAITATLDPSRISLKTEKEFEGHIVEMEGEERRPESDRDMLVRNIVKTSMENPEIAAKTLKTFFREE